MFTQKLTAWRENRGQKRLGFREKFRWRKVEEILDTFTASPPNNTSHHWPLHRMKEGIFIAITMFSRGLGALREQHPPLREHGGEQGGEPRGARWGAVWRNAQRFTQHHRAGNLRWTQWNVSARIRHNHMRHIKVGRPGLPARPTSSAVCLRRQSLSLRLSQRRS